MDVRVGLWRKLSAEELMLLNCGVGEDSWESLGLQEDPTSPTLKRRSVLGVHWKDWCWSWNSNTLATSCKELTHWKRPWCWEGLGAGGEGDDRGWDGWMVWLTLWTWVWVNSGRWWWTGRPGMLQFMGSQRVGHNWATELNWIELNWTEREDHCQNISAPSTESSPACQREHNMHGLRVRERPGKTTRVTFDCSLLILCYQWFLSIVSATTETKLQRQRNSVEIRLKLQPFPNSCRVNTIFSQPVRCTKFLKELLLWPFSPSSDMNHWK